MNLKEALDEYHKAKSENLGNHKELTGITLTGKGGLKLTPEMIESNDWGITITNSDPEFVSLVGSLMNNLRGIDKPHLVKIEGGKNDPA